jgi:hypothetical protein
MNIIKNLSILATAAFLTSCAHHLSESECRDTNWHSVGFQDALNGFESKNLEQEKKDCNKFNIKLDHKSYSAGWDKGMKQYCTEQNGYDLGVQGLSYSTICHAEYYAAIDAGYTRGIRKFCKNPDNAYNLGRSGLPYPNFCPPELEAEFRNGYAEGARILHAIKSLQAEISSIDASIIAKQRRIGDLDWQLGRHDISREQFRSLNWERQELVRSIEDLRYSRARLVSQKSDIEIR